MTISRLTAQKPMSSTASSTAAQRPSKDLNPAADARNEIVGRAIDARLSKDVNLKPTLALDTFDAAPATSTGGLPFLPPTSSGQGLPNAPALPGRPGQPGNGQSAASSYGFGHGATTAALGSALPGQRSTFDRSVEGPESGSAFSDSKFGDPTSGAYLDGPSVHSASGDVSDKTGDAVNKVVNTIGDVAKLVAIRSPQAGAVMGVGVGAFKVGTALVEAFPKLGTAPADFVFETKEKVKDWLDSDSKEEATTSAPKTSTTTSDTAPSNEGTPAGKAKDASPGRESSPLPGGPNSLTEAITRMTTQKTQSTANWKVRPTDTHEEGTPSGAPAGASRGESLVNRTTAQTRDLSAAAATLAAKTQVLVNAKVNPVQPEVKGRGKV